MVALCARPAPANPEGWPFGATRLIEGIEIVGNQRTEASVIRSHISLRAGDPVDEERIEASRIRLLSTGFFRQVEFGLRRGSARGQVLLVVEVEEKNTLRIEDVAFGFGAGHVPFAALGVSESNFLGRGVTVGGAFALAEDRGAAELRLFVPSLAGTPLQLAGQVGFTDAREVVDPTQPEGPSFGYQRVGGSLGLGFVSGPAQRVSIAFRLEALDVDRLPNLPPPVLRRAPSILGDGSVLSTLSATWEQDTRDDGFAPSRGTRVALGVELGSSAIGSSYEFSKYTGELQWALPTVGGQALVLHGAAGLIQGETPFFNQFFARDHARFSYRRPALPRAVQVNFSVENDYDDLLLHVGAEYTWPMLQAKGWLSRILLYAAADFVTTASLAEAQDDVEGRGAFTEFPLTLDAGLKIDTEFGRFTLSLAYALDLVL